MTAPGVGGAQQLHPLLVAAEERLLGGLRGEGEGGQQQQQHGVSSALVTALAHGHGIRGVSGAGGQTQLSTSEVTPGCLGHPAHCLTV